MKASEVPTKAARLNDNQQYALTRMLRDGEERRQDRGLKRPLRAKDCPVPWGYRSGVAASTRRSLARRGLTTGDDWQGRLTADGFQVAQYLFNEQTRDVKIESELAPGIVYTPTNVEEYVTATRRMREREAKAHAERVKRAARLWRGIAIPHYTGKKRAMATVIKETFDASRATWRSSVDLDLDDLIAIGEQMEERRK